MPTGDQPLPEKAGTHPDRLEGERPYKVYIHNDDVTPMDFVVHVLVMVFLVPTLNAGQIMYAAHLNGRAYVQTLPAAEARRRIAKARFAARLRGFPLEFSMEAE
ncbi:MAG: ATP-dependent Clp protease adaptor ClpS [Chloroflexota bacterium]